MHICVFILCPYSAANQRPYSPTASDEGYVQIHKEDGMANDTTYYQYPEETLVDAGPTTASDYEVVVIDSSTVERNDTPEMFPTTANTSHISQYS